MTIISKEKKPIIFDLDGTLWNALPNTAIAWNNGLIDTGLAYSVTDTDLARVVGKPFDQCVEALFPGVIEKYPELLGNIDKHEIEIIRKHGGLIYDGVKTGIEKLAEKYPLFMVSNCQTWYLEAFLDFADLRKYFTDYDCFGTSSMPKAEMIREMTKKHKLERAIYIGDTISDYKAAKEGGVEFIHAAFGFGTVPPECKYAKSFEELLLLI
jgi:phosphoglycolate phosphatase